VKDSVLMPSEFELFKSVVMFDANEIHERDDGTSLSLDVGHSELYERFCTFRQRVEDLEATRSRSWRAVRQTCERYLDASHPVVHDVFNTHSHLVLESGQGTNKTGVLFSMLLIELLKDPRLRVLILSNRKTYASTVRERGKDFDRDISSAFGVELGFRSYTEEYFRAPSTKTFARDGSDAGAYERAVATANRRLAAAPRLILSEQSIGRLFAATTEGGTPIVPYYDIVVPDEFMELMSIVYGSTMHEKRRMGLEYMSSLLTRAKKVWVADANIVDETALPLLKGLTRGKPFVKLQNTAKTIKRQYVIYSSLAAWRQALYDFAQRKKKVIVASNTKAQVESIVNDPALIELGIRIKGLHADSPACDRKDYVNSVERWDQLDLLAYSPVISHGVNFDKPHFDEAFLFASDNSTTAVQTFQQLNRARRIASDRVHVFIDANPKKHATLSCSYDDLKAELNEEVRKFHGDFFTRCIKSADGRERASTPVVRLPLVDQYGPAPKCHATRMEDELHGSGRYVLDTRVDPTSCVRALFDSLGNELYLRTQVAINRSRVHFEKLLLEEFTSAGGVVVSALDPDEAQSKKRGKAIRVADGERKAAGLVAILNAPDVVCEQELARLRWRRQVHDLKEGELEKLMKVEWKETYGIALSDTTRLHSVEDFVGRFGAPRRLQQAQHLASLGKEQRAVVVSLVSDPIGYQARESNYRDHVDLILQSAGFGTFCGASTVVAAEQQLLLQPGHAHRYLLLKRWEQTPLSHQGWWLGWKKENAWTARSDVAHLELHGSDGQAVSGAALFQAFFSGCRQFVLSRFGIKVASGRLRLPGGERSYVYQLDRTHWNEFSTTLTGLSPQQLDGRVKNSASKAPRRKSSASGGSTDLNLSVSDSGLSERSDSLTSDTDTAMMFSPDHSAVSDFGSAEAMDVSEEPATSRASAVDDEDDSISDEELSDLLRDLNDRNAATVRRLVPATRLDAEEEGWLPGATVRALVRSMRMRVSMDL
jgi:hypothetical protein